MARLLKIAALAASSLAIAGSLTMPASAHRGGGHWGGGGGGSGDYTEENYTVSKPVKGYTGSPVGAGPGVFCDYIRTPIRACIPRADGTESCKVTGYNIKQFCRR